MANNTTLNPYAKSFQLKQKTNLEKEHQLLIKKSDLPYPKRFKSYENFRYLIKRELSNNVKNNVKQSSR